MFTELLESKARPVRRRGSVVASLLIHTAIVIVAVAGTTSVHSDADAALVLPDSGVIEGTLAELVLPLAGKPLLVTLDRPGGRPAWATNEVAWVTGRVVVDVLVDASGKPDTSTLAVVDADDPLLVEALRSELATGTIAPAAGETRSYPEVVRLRVAFVRQ